jgi:polyhydroxybutyrate depolymerase
MRLWKRVRALAAVAAVGVAVWVVGRPRASTPAGAATNALVAARPYRIAAPAVIDPRRSYPLVLVLHGWGGSSEHVEGYYQLDRLVDERGVLVAYPEGTKEPWTRHLWSRQRRFWNATDGCCNFFGSEVDDVAYLDAVIDDVGAHYRVDPKRIFVMGLSNGGYMSYRYACDRAGRVAAIVSQAGAMWADATRCKPSEPVAVLEIHGTNDEMVPYGSRAPTGPDDHRVPSAHQSVADWVALDHCDPTPDTSAPPRDLLQDTSEGASGGPDAETTTERWTGCPGVELWTMHGARHVPRVNQPLWAQSIYGWLAAHPKP